ncbi:MAG: hypothetical protein KAJ39_06420 [Gammaproteobacteria bacterium]|nr:hypothetical protein [Gammaproteobacteria bacterium]
MTSVIKEIFTKLHKKYNICCASCPQKFISSEEHYAHIIKCHKSAELPDRGMSIIESAEDRIKSMGFDICSGSGYLMINPDGTRIQIAREVDVNGTVDDAVRLIFERGHIHNQKLYL